MSNASHALCVMFMFQWSFFGLKLDVVYRFNKDRQHSETGLKESILKRIWHISFLNGNNTCLDLKGRAKSKCKMSERFALGCYDRESRSRLCSLLGLKPDFLDRLEEVPPEFRDHWTINDWVVNFVRNNCESVCPRHRNSLSKDLLDEIGFDPLSTAAETIIRRSYEASTQLHIEACEWAGVFIEDELKYNILLCPLVVKFPFHSSLNNTWFQLPVIAKNKNNNDDLCTVNIMNVVTQEASSTTQSVLSDLIVSQDETNIVLYHGTDHQSATDILDRGIDLSAGRQKRDFSCGSGFYLTKRLDDALDWAKSTTAKPAILVFLVDREYLNDARILNLFEDERRWREIVSSYRSGKGTARTRKSFEII